MKRTTNPFSLFTLTELASVSVAMRALIERPGRSETAESLMVHLVNLTAETVDWMNSNFTLSEREEMASLMECEVSALPMLVIADCESSYGRFMPRDAIALWFDDGFIDALPPGFSDLCD
jgi:hypothetical protein